ncbi:LEM domain-containing protein 1 isoform X2 [Parambassis ranga]|uniref:LEM domain-containing protein 1 isoform X2 n=1 Tax=Parambassis ranga TaxID=210632 RepID=A0A6P7IBJ4_9TELE|nr:lamina-associated polypeptide 2, isoforms beta/gamma-like isoform X2 [Parambassis ranga]
MPFEEDPAYLSKSRLKSDLVAHNVALPPAASKKEIYVELHLKHIDQRNAADFSSDEEDLVPDVADREEDPDHTEIPDPRTLTDDELKAALLHHGVKAGPIVGTTRAVYEKKLKKLLQPDESGKVNGAEKAVVYSDSEEEEEEEVEEEEQKADGEEEVEESVCTESEKQTAEQTDLAKQESSQAKLPYQNGSFPYLQCFMPSSRLHARPTSNRESKSKWNSRNAVKSSERSRSRCKEIPVGISRASSVDQHSGLGSGVPSGSQSVMSNGCSSFSSQAFSITQMVKEMESRSLISSSTDADRELNVSNVQEHRSQPIRPPQEPMKDIIKEIFPETGTTPTGIHATRRRPIKGAAQRPVQYGYPATPVSPATLERREMERRRVPIRIQILVFLIMACILYFIYVNLEDICVVLLDSLNQGFDSEDGYSLQAETEDTQVVSGQD